MRRMAFTAVGMLSLLAAGCGAAPTALPTAVTAPTAGSAPEAAGKGSFGTKAVIVPSRAIPIAASLPWVGMWWGVGIISGYPYPHILPPTGLVAPTVLVI